MFISSNSSWIGHQNPFYTEYIHDFCFHFSSFCFKQTIFVLIVYSDLTISTSMDVIYIYIYIYLFNIFWQDEEVTWHYAHIHICCVLLYAAKEIKISYCEICIVERRERNMPFDVFSQVQIHVVEIIMKFHVSKKWFSMETFCFLLLCFSLFFTHPTYILYIFFWSHIYFEYC